MNLTDHFANCTCRFFYYFCFCSFFNPFLCFYKLLLCFRDTIIPPIQPTTETDRIIKELNDIRKNMSHGESFSRASDARNVWLKEPLTSELSKPVQPHLLVYPVFFVEKIFLDFLSFLIFFKNFINFYLIARIFYDI